MTNLKRRRSSRILRASVLFTSVTIPLCALFTADLWLFQAGVILDNKGHFRAAELLLRADARIYEWTRGAEDLQTATVLTALGMTQTVEGDYKSADKSLRRAFAISEKKRGRVHLETAPIMAALADNSCRSGDYSEAETLLQLALAIREKGLGESHPDTTSTMLSLAQCYQVQGDYSRARPLLERAIAIDTSLRRNGLPLANELSNLGELFWEEGKLDRAEPLLKRALSIIDNELGADNPVRGRQLHDLGELYKYKGDFAKAEPLLRQSLAIAETMYGPMHGNTAVALDNLADLYRDEGKYAAAEPLVRRALAIDEKVLGPQHLETATTLNNLALLYMARGGYGQAEPLINRALEVDKKVLGLESPITAASIETLAELYRLKGDYARAQPLYESAVSIWQKTLGPEAPDVAKGLNNLAVLQLALDHPKESCRLLTASLTIEDANMSRVLMTGSEAQKVAYLAMMNRSASLAHSLQSTALGPAGWRLGLLTALSRKARVVDAMSDSLGRIRRRADREGLLLIDQLSETTFRLSKIQTQGLKSLNSPNQWSVVRELQQKLDTLEARISDHDPAFQLDYGVASVEHVQAALPLGAALVEIVQYDQIKLSKTLALEKTPHYVAYILRTRGNPDWVDLGDVASIDVLCNQFRVSLGSPDNATLSAEIARRLDVRVMQPIGKHLKGLNRLFLSPDGQLNLIPFAALRDETGHYVGERYQITYLSTGRDLLRWQEHQNTRGDVVVFANPAYGHSAEQVRGSGYPASQAVASIYFQPLPGTAVEADAIKSLFSNAKIFEQNEVTKNALMRLSSPKILHLATHGFFKDTSVDSKAQSHGDDNADGLMVNTGVRLEVE
jgi:tetratricopeptide (TPR) repeat protein